MPSRTGSSGVSPQKSPRTPCGGFPPHGSLPSSSCTMLAVVRASITNSQSPCCACYSARLFFVTILHCDYAGAGFMREHHSTQCGPCGIAQISFFACKNLHEVVYRHKSTCLASVIEREGTRGARTCRNLYCAQHTDLHVQSGVFQPAELVSPSFWRRKTHVTQSHGESLGGEVSFRVLLSRAVFCRHNTCTSLRWQRCLVKDLWWFHTRWIAPIPSTVRRTKFPILQ